MSQLEIFDIKSL